MTRHLINASNCLFLMLLIAACNSNTEVCKYAMDYLPIEDNEKDSYALLGADAQIMDVTFDESPTPVINGFFAVEEENGLTLCKLKNTGYEKIENASGFEEVGIMNDGLIPVCKDYEQIQVLNENGDPVFTLGSLKGIEVRMCYSYSSEKMRVQMADGTFAYVDKQGNQLFDRFYEWCSDFEQDVAVVNVEEDTYALIDKQGKELFTFDCEDYEKIKFSPRYEKLVTVDKDGRIIIYDFQGQQIGIYPSKVEAVAVLCKESFIFEKDDCYGIMEYSGKELIRAKYDALVPNGKYYLAIHEDNDEEVKIIDDTGNVLKSIDGEEIYPFRCMGYDFPNMIKRSDDEIYIVDDYGETVGKGAVNFCIDEDDIIEAGCVSNCYFPQDDVLAEIMKWCGHGRGIPEGQNGFFLNDGNRCHPYEVNFIKNVSDISSYKGAYSASTCITKGINHSVIFRAGFDEQVVRGDSLSRSAWLTSMVIEVYNSNIFLNAAFFNVCKNKLCELGCSVRYSHKNDHILISKDGENLIVLKHDTKRTRFLIYLDLNNEYNVAYWNRSISNAT